MKILAANFEYRLLYVWTGSFTLIIETASNKWDFVNLWRDLPVANNTSGAEKYKGE